MALEIPNVFHALCYVTGTTGAMVINQGIASCVRNVGGDYSIVLATPIAIGENVAFANIAGGVIVGVAIPTQFDSTNFAVKCFVTITNVKTDSDFMFAVLKVK